jgi:hypothetical protein
MLSSAFLHNLRSLRVAAEMLGVGTCLLSDRGAAELRGGISSPMNRVRQ